MPIIIGGISGTLWGSRGRKVVTSLCGLVMAVTGSVVGIAQAAPIVEPWWFAHRGYVRSSEVPILDRLITVQLTQNRNERERLLEEVKKRELELQSDQAKATPQYGTLVQQRVDRIKQRLDELDKDDGSLFKEKTGK